MLKHSLLYPKTTKTRLAIKLDGMWRFKIDFEGGKDYSSGVPTNDTIPVPASFQDFYTDKNIREFVGDVWYESDIVVPKAMEGERVFLRFSAATHRADVYLNGEFIESHEGGFLPFLAEITDKAKYGEINKVVVKVNNELTETNIPCGRTIVLKNGKKMSKPYFDFYNYSGLQRSVYLLSVPKSSIDDISLTYEIVGKDAKINYSVKTNGGGEVFLSLYDEEGKLVASSESKKGILSVENAHLWKIRNAYLYRLLVEIKDGSSLLDSYSLDIGIRTVEIKGESILLNGEPIYLKGFGKHEDSDIVGRGFNIGVMKRDFELMKWIGANSFRTSHYPYDEEIYLEADREGFLIIDEVPAVGLFESLMNFLDAGTGKNAGSFFLKETTPILLKAHLKAIEEMIVRDKNHPSVIAWSLLNEPEAVEDAAVPYFEELYKLALELDPEKRPRTFAMESSANPERSKCHHLSDFLSLNRYYGWYIQGGYEISDAKEKFIDEMERWKALNLNKPFVFTEYGADTLATEHKVPSVMWSQEYQKEVLEMLHSVFDSYSFVKGEQIWNFADFQTTEGLMRVNGNKKGVFTRQRQPKDAAYLLKERWESLPDNYKA